MSHWSSASFMVLACTVGVSVCSLARTVQLTQNGHDAAGAVHVFNVVLVGIGCYLAQLRHDLGHAVDVGHGEVDFGFLRNGQDVQNGVGGAAHGNVQRNGVFKRLEAPGTRQHAAVVLLVITLAQLHCQASGALEQVARGRQCVATTVPLPGKARPSASVRQFMELAVNMPEHDPQVGQAERSTSARSASDTLSSAAITMASIRSSFLNSGCACRGWPV
jgi:hypothetical protein